ncbi:GTP-binding protein [Trypanosoma theileri]|uniref:GTP-binding protein n=1 Tax=Trypanosoma theileri TaxID=67003 RepID=A0A1X0P4S5_9TRYP|nr:GTP-binding protein [Trypanosoma theileri]ORC91936.1 GTP-binding protein [Trypanosoma theileri]
MPVWQRSKPQRPAVSLDSASESRSSSSSSTCSSHSSTRSSSPVQSPSIASRSAGSASQLPPRAKRSSSLSVFPHMGGGVLMHTGMLRTVQQGGRMNHGAMSVNGFARTLSTGGFASSSLHADDGAHTTVSRGSNSLMKMSIGNTIGETMRILVIGAPQVGKSSLVNSYRAAVTSNTKWPAAPVGICGFCGTTTVDPFPNHPTEPTWLCIDTPGKLYDAKDQVLLERLFAGMPWKTRLAGKDALQLEQIERLPIVNENKAHQCIIVVPATDLIEDNGWMSVFQLKSRYSPAPDAEGVVMYLRNLVCTIRPFLYDASPFVVVTKMDLVGGAGNSLSRNLISSLLTQCIPINRLYFSASPDDHSTYGTKCRLVVDRDTRESLLRLHEDISMTFRWRKSIEGSA